MSVLVLMIRAFISKKDAIEQICTIPFYLCSFYINSEIQCDNILLITNFNVRCV